MVPPEGGPHTPMKTVWENRRECDGPCSGCEGCDSPYPLGGLGDVNAEVMLIAQEPAYNVNEQRDGLMNHQWAAAKDVLEYDREETMNPLWRHMSNIALAADCDPRDLYFTNIAKCGGDDFDERADHCTPYLVDEIARVQPQAILLHGNKVITRVYEMLGLDYEGVVGDVHGEYIETSVGTILPLYHWGYSYRRGNVPEYNHKVAEAVNEIL